MSTYVDLRTKFKRSYTKNHNGHRNAFIVSHGKCNDGLAAAHIATHFLNLLADAPFPDDHVFFLEHSNDHIKLFNDVGIFNKLDESNGPITLMVLDFSLSAEVLGMLYGRYPDIKVIVLDHHKSTIDTYTHPAFKNTFKSVIKSNKLQFMYSSKYSGAVLAYLFFNLFTEPLSHLVWMNYKEINNEIVDLWYGDDVFPSWVMFIHDRDTWSWTLKNSRPFTTMFMRYAKSLNDIRAMLPFENGLHTSIAISTVLQWCEVGEAICEHMEELTKEVSLDAENVSLTLGGVKYRGVILNASHCFTSDVGNLLVSNPGVDFAIMYRVTGVGKVKVGLRSLANFNCIPVARYWNGGGHPQASGCNFDTLVDFVNKMYQPLKDGNVIIGN